MKTCSIIATAVPDVLNKELPSYPFGLVLLLFSNTLASFLLCIRSVLHDLSTPFREQWFLSFPFLFIARSPLYTDLTAVSEFNKYNFYSNFIDFIDCFDYGYGKLQWRYCENFIRQKSVYKYFSSYKLVNVFCVENASH